MRRTQPIKVGDLWDDFLKNSPMIARKVAEARISEVWEEVAGGFIAGQTTSIEVSKGVMNVKVNSSIVRSELFMRRKSLCQELNSAVGMDVIRTIIIK